MKLKIEFGFGIGFRGNGDGILVHEQRAGMKEVGDRAVSLFGGYAGYDTFRAWRDPDTDIVVTEPGCTISVLVEDEWGLDRDVELMVEQIKNSLQQKAVAVTSTKVAQFDIL